MEINRQRMGAEMGGTGLEGRGLCSYWLRIMVCIFLFLNAGTARSANPDINEVIKALKATDVPITNLKVERFTLKSFHSESAAGPWVEDKEFYSGTFWHDGQPGGKVRFDMESVLPWIAGTAPFAQSIQSLGYDGKESRRADHSSGPLGKMREARIGVVSANRNIEFDVPSLLRASGVSFSRHLRKEEGSLLSEFIEKANKTKVEGVKVTTELDGESGSNWVCVKITRESFGIDHRYWFDPSRGWALRKAVIRGFREKNDDQSTTTMVIDELVEAAPGVWYPTKAWKEEREKSEPGVFRRRYEYAAENAVINDPAFDESIYTVQFPMGYLVTDNVNDEVYRVPMKPGKVEEQLGKPAAEAKRLEPAAAMPGKNVPVGSTNTGFSSITVFLWAAAIFVCVGGLLIWIVMAKNRRTN